MRRLMLYSGSLGSGGAERQMLYIARGMIEKGIKTAIVTDYPTNHYMSMLENLEIKLYCTETTGRQLIRRMLNIRKIIRDFKPDVFHTFRPGKNLYGTLIAKLCGVETIFASLRNTDSYEFQGIGLYKNWVSGIIANSKLAADLATGMHNVPTELVHTVHNGIDLTHFEGKKRQEIGRSLGVCIGRFMPQKNHLALLKAVKKLRESGLLESLTLQLIGVEDNRRVVDTLKDFVEGNDLGTAVTFCGPSNNINLILSQSDFLVLPSLYEGFPNVVMEAMASKTFVIATPVGGTPELVEDGVNGILTKSPAPEHLALGIERYLLMSQQERKRIVDTAYECIQEYSIEKMIERIKRIYEGKVDSCREDSL